MPSKPPKKPDPDGVTYIYRPHITLPNGTVIWAKNYGKRAFRIAVAATSPAV